MKNILFDMIERWESWNPNVSPYFVATYGNTIAVDIFDLSEATCGLIKDFSDTYVRNQSGVFEQNSNAYEFTVKNCYMKAPAFVNSSIDGTYYASRVLYNNCVFETCKVPILNVTFEDCIWLGDATT